jgi:predicted tellurium resistance membrane protein TerC
MKYQNNKDLAEAQYYLKMLDDFCKSGQVKIPDPTGAAMPWDLKEDPFVVFFSNIFAILGLRALFFLLAAIADKFRYLKVGVSVLLVFIGVKMLIHDFFEIDAVSSLVFIILVLLVSIGASVVIPQKKEA